MRPWSQPGQGRRHREKIDYDLLLIAAGSKTCSSGSQGANLPGVFTLRTIADVEAMGRYLESTHVERPSSSAALVSLRSAEAFRKLGISVTIVVSSAG